MQQYYNMHIMKYFWSTFAGNKMLRNLLNLQQKAVYFFFVWAVLKYSLQSSIPGIWLQIMRNAFPMKPFPNFVKVRFSFLLQIFIDITSTLRLMNREKSDGGNLIVFSNLCLSVFSQSLPGLLELGSLKTLYFKIF